MIFVTVGMQLPFPRLILYMDRLAARLDCRIVAQIGSCRQIPRNFEYHHRLSASQFSTFVSEAKLIVGHAGVGTILSARRAGKPLILFPRRADLGEHRSDHQLATCEEMRGRAGVHVALDEESLEAILLSQATLTAPDAVATGLISLRTSIQSSLAEVLASRVKPATEHPIEV